MMPWLFLRKKCRRITLIKSVSQPRLLTSRRDLNFTFPSQTTAFLSQSIISHRVLEAVASRILKSLFRLEVRDSWIMPSNAEEIQEQIFAFVPARMFLLFTIVTVL